YFEQHVFTADAFWSKANKLVPVTALLVLYRGAFFYGTSRWIAWTLWAHVLHHYPYDLSWGGPHWIHQAHSSKWLLASRVFLSSRASRRAPPNPPRPRSRGSDRRARISPLTPISARCSCTTASRSGTTSGTPAATASSRTASSTTHSPSSS